ncbi:MAG: DUF4349 domain-containing protein [Candidatus Azobacteroides sp.]|nr:DUF4349 domain-containing protein [Candidatus Azobacteroides sp.]
MKKRIIFCFWVSVLFLFSCGSDDREEPEMVTYDIEASSPETSSASVGMEVVDMKDIISSSVAIPGKQDSLRKFIRTACLNFRTQDVIQAIYAIEEIAERHDGFTQKSDLISYYHYDKYIKVSKDSTLKLIYYTLKADMVIRVPVSALDATLKEIAPWIEYLDYRKLEANDVHLLLLSTQLTQNREKQGIERVKNAIDNQEKRFRETIQGEELLSEKKRRSDEALLAKLTMEDKINYSTIYLSVYGNEMVKKEIIAHEENIEGYRPGFIYRLTEACKAGWNAFIEVILFLANLWAFILLVIVIIVSYKTYKKKKTARKKSSTLKKE